MLGGISGSGFFAGSWNRSQSSTRVPNTLQKLAMLPLNESVLFYFVVKGSILMVCFCNFLVLTMIVDGFTRFDIVQFVVENFHYQECEYTDKIEESNRSALSTVVLDRLAALQFANRTVRI
jgi:hypothetical protein